MSTRSPKRIVVLGLVCLGLQAESAGVAVLTPGSAIVSAQSQGRSVGGRTVPPARDSQRLLQAADLVYVGAFRVPADAAGVGKRGFEYGGGALAYNPARDSLFIVGHDWDQMSAEITIPPAGGTARVLQALADPVEGTKVSVDEDKVGGQLVYNGRLLVTKFGFFDATVSQTASHFIRPLDLAVKGQVSGPHKVGKLGAGFYSGYMAPVPRFWQTALKGPVLTGNCCLSILNRTSYGPAVSTIDPALIGTSEHAVPLVYYTQDHQTLGVYGEPGKHPVFNGSTRIRGLVFPEGTASILFVGTTGIGNYCYGYAPDCGAPGHDKGEHAYPYRAYVWAYDANHLAAVAAGRTRPWNVKPYATWELPLKDVGFDTIGGAAYDASSGRLFVSQRVSDGERPTIHVFRIPPTP